MTDAIATLTAAYVDMEARMEKAREGEKGDGIR